MKHLVHHVHFDKCIVLVFLAAVATVVIALTHPLALLAAKRDQVRAEDTRDILAALVEYKAANSGELPTGIDADATTYQLLGQQTFGCEQRCKAALTLDACLDLSLVMSETGLERTPVDPTNGSDFMTGYAVNVREGGRLDVVACSTSGTDQIKASQ